MGWTPLLLPFYHVCHFVVVFAWNTVRTALLPFEDCSTVVLMSTFCASAFSRELHLFRCCLTRRTAFRELRTRILNRFWLRLSAHGNTRPFTKRYFIPRTALQRRDGSLLRFLFSGRLGSARLQHGQRRYHWWPLPDVHISVKPL